jgi:FAD dependent oxidoreductase TIGR03364
LSRGFDLALVGAGVVGLAHAWAAARLGKRVVVIDRDARPNGASIRNFGFVTVTGQQEGEVWRRARRSRDLWARMAPQAGITVEQRGMVLPFRRPESEAVARAFLTTAMGEGCAVLDPAELANRFPMLRPREALGALISPHELRVESPLAIPALRAWLEKRWGVEFRWLCAALEVAPPRVLTSRGVIEAEAAVICPGDDLVSLYPDVIERRGVTRCRLSMLRLADPGFRLPSAVMSDLGLVRYLGYAELREAEALRRVLQAEQPAHLRHGIHLIVTQNADGSLVVGDSHHYADTPDPFAAAEVEALILEELETALGAAAPPVIERWTGTYSSAPNAAMFCEAPSANTRLVMVTSGTGASTAFAIAEEVIGELYGATLGDDGL